jgi:hypothetical protein
MASLTALHRRSFTRRPGVYVGQNQALSVMLPKRRQ